MTEKRFTFDRDTVATNLKTPIVYDGEKMSIGEVLDKLNELHGENKGLQERNNRQAKRLDDIYRLIEQKDWRALSDIMDDFKRNDEQLQREWKCYE